MLEAEIRTLKAESKEAELELKCRKTNDDYKLLGMSRDCSYADNMKAYRTQRPTHHPDKVRITSFSVVLYFDIRLSPAAWSSSSSSRRM